MAVITNSNAVILGTNSADTITALADGANIYGYSGNDDYFINAFFYHSIAFGGPDVPADIIHEEVGGGIDTVHVDLFASYDGTSYNIYGSRSYTLEANVENLVANLNTVYSANSFSLLGNDLANNIAVTGTSDTNANIYGLGGNDTLTGGLGNDTLNGGTGNDTLIGGTGNDTLNGYNGNDSMVGGAGDDTYFVDSTLDKVIEAVGAGIDLVNSTVNFTLGANVENLSFTAAANLTGIGNALNNIIYGNGGNNVLNGGAGDDYLDGSFDDDTLIGGTGDDTLIGGTTGNDKLDGGAGNDSLYGGVGNDTFLGGAGNDILGGEAGNDKLDGGAGNDRYFDVDAGDIVTDIGGGIDIVYSSVQLSGDLGAGIDNLILTGSDNISGRGNALNNGLIGNSGNNLLEGLAGNDSIFGFAGVDILLGGDGNDILDGGAGADLMNGGNGNDTYVVDDLGDVAVETNALAAGGIDSVSSSVDFVLGANLENLTLTGSAIFGYGNTSANIITGNSGDNKLYGFGGIDMLDGGAGADTMDGGSGDDTYIVDDAGDLVSDGIGGGTDLVKSSLTFSLVDTDGGGIFGDNVENLTLTGSGNIDGAGNALNNTLIGNAGNNVLYGGLGNDTMTGGAGNDEYYVDSVLDKVVEAVGGGTDKVIVNSGSILAFTLGANVENLSIQGVLNVNATGNALNNYISGNDGNNSLSALGGNDTLYGGLGADTMNGGSGNDIYFVDNAGDKVIDSTGIDKVYSAVSFTLGATLENLTLYGSGSITGTGNALANILTSNNGIDTLIGGAGNDTYIVNNVFDIVDETSGSGIDLVKASDSFSLELAASTVENLTLIGSSNINGTGNNIANIITGNSGTNMLTGLDGNDTYIVGVGDTVVEAIGFGTADTVKSSVSFALNDLLGVGVENLTLTGTNVISGTGNSLNNILIGNSASNILTGGAGADTMKGGASSDVYYVDDLGDVIIELANAGQDMVYSSVQFTLGLNVDNLRLQGVDNISGTGNALDNRIYGNYGHNVLTGNAGSDQLTDNQGGNDTLDGGLGNDVLEGGVGIDSLIGGAGNDTLDGGADADVMIGGAGNDFYFVDDAGDIITEDVNAGIDTVYSSVAFTLFGTNLENLTFYGGGGLDGTGNDGNNTILGNYGNNTLTGLGGSDTLDGRAGVDTMDGGAGNDTYIVDNGGDRVTELAGAGTGTDLVKSSVTFNLGDSDQDFSFSGVGDNVENLTLTGSGDIGGSGNALANVITGNDGDNMLDGGGSNDTLIGGLGDDQLYGGLGNDSMTGGAGNDIYFVDSLLDKVVEAAGGGTDTVYSAINFSLVALTNIENLHLLGSGNINGTGNALNNIIYGYTGNNVLNGGAGNDVLFGHDGVDTLSGGTGNDEFWFAFSNTGTADTITDFVSGVDSIQLNSFAGLTFDGAGGSLNSSQFVSGAGAVANDTSDFIIFDSTTGNLYYDSDGSDPTAAVQIAHFNGGVTVTSTDIFELAP